MRRCNKASRCSSEVFAAVSMFDLVPPQMAFCNSPELAARRCSAAGGPPAVASPCARGAHKNLRAVLGTPACSLGSWGLVLGYREARWSWMYSSSASSEVLCSTPTWTLAGGSRFGAPAAWWATGCNFKFDLGRSICSFGSNPGFKTFPVATCRGVASSSVSWWAANSCQSSAAGDEAAGFEPNLAFDGIWFVAGYLQVIRSTISTPSWSCIIVESASLCGLLGSSSIDATCVWHAWTIWENRLALCTSLTCSSHDLSPWASLYLDFMKVHHGSFDQAAV